MRTSEDANPTTPDFFVAGGTLNPTVSSYVEREADAQLTEALAAGEYCYVLDTRQMGKSSLMVRTARRLQERGIAVAVLDLTSVGQNLTVERWYAGLLARLDEQLKLNGMLLNGWRTQKDLGGLQRFLDGLHTILRVLPGRVVIFVDEVDAVRSLPFPADEFFIGIRECYNRRSLDPVFDNLAFCLLGVASPPDLIRDTRLSPFNIGRRITLTDFTAEEAAKLTRAIKGGESIGQRILYWTGGHPYLTQRLCREIAHSDQWLTTAHVDSWCERLFLTREAREADDNLSFVRNRLLQSEVDRAALLDLYAAVLRGKTVREDANNPLCSVLRLSGVVRADKQGVFCVRNRIYQQVFDLTWIHTHMPDAELRRQRTAFWRGVLRTAGVSAAVVVALIAMAAFAVHSERQASKRERLANEQLTRLRAENGIRLLANGDPIAALQPLQEALALDENYFPERLPISRLRLAYAKRMTPQIIREWSADGVVRWAAYSPDGTTLITATDRGSVEFWNTKTGERLRQERYPKAVDHFAFSPNGRWIAVGCNDGRVHVVDWRTGKERYAPLLHYTGNESSSVHPRLTWSRDGHLLAVAAFPGVSLWDAETGRSISRVWDDDVGKWTAARMPFNPVTPSEAVFLPGNKFIAFSAFRYLPNYADIASGKMLAGVAPNWFAYGIRLSPDGKRLLLLGNSSGSVPETIWQGAGLYDPYPKRNPLLRPISLRHSEPVQEADFSPDGKRVATASSDGTARIWETATGKPLTPELRHRAAIAHIRFNHSGRWVLTAGGDTTARVWDSTTGEPVGLALRHDAPLQFALFTPDETAVLTVTAAGRLRLWQLPIPNAGVHPLLPTNPSATYTRVSWAGPNLLHLSDNTPGVAEEQRNRLLDAETGKPILLPTRPGFYCWRTDDRGKYTLYRKGNQFYIYDLKTRSEIGLLPERYSTGIVEFYRDPTGERLLVQGPDSKPGVTVAYDIKAQPIAPSIPDNLCRRPFMTSYGVRWILLIPTPTPGDGPDGLVPAVLFERATGRSVSCPLFLNKMKGIKGEADLFFYDWTPDERYLVTGDTDGRVIATDTGKTVARIGRPGFSIRKIRFSPDSRQVLVATSDSAVQVFETETGKPLIAPLPHPGPITDAVLSPNGRLLATGCTDTALRLWDAHTGEPITDPIFTGQYIKEVCFSPDSRQVRLTLKTGMVEAPYVIDLL